MKIKIIWWVLLTNFLFGDNLCLFDDSIFKSTIEKKYAHELEGLDQGEYVKCAYVDNNKKGFIIFSYFKTINKEGNQYAVTLITVLVDRNSSRVLESSFHKNIYVTSDKDFSLSVDSKSYQNISSRETLGMHVKFIKDRCRLDYLTLYEIDGNRTRTLLSNFLYKNYNEEMINSKKGLKYWIFRKSTLSSYFKHHKKETQYEPLVFEQNFNFTYGDKDKMLNPQWDKSWNVNLTAKKFLFKNGNYQAVETNSEPLFNLKQVVKNTKKGLKYKRVVLDAMLFKEKISKKNIEDYEQIALNLYEHKRYVTAEMLLENIIDYNKERIKSNLYLGNIYWKKAKEVRGAIDPNMRARDCYYYEMEASAYEIKATNYHRSYMRNMITPYKDDKKRVEILLKETTKQFRDRVHNSLLDIDKELIENVLYHDASIFKILDNAIRNDKKIATIAVEQDFTNMKYLGSKLKTDADFVYGLIKEDKKNIYLIKFVDVLLTKDKKFMYDVSYLNGVNFAYAEDNLKKNKEYIVKLLDKKVDVFEYVDDSVKSDKDFLIKYLRTRGRFPIGADKKFLKDKVFALELASQRGMASHVDEKFYSDPEVMWLLSVDSMDYKKRLDEKLKNNYDFMLALAKVDDYTFKYIPKEFITKRDFILLKVQQSPYIFKELNSSIKNDRIFILEVAKKHGGILEYVNKKFQDDREIVFLCTGVKHYGSNITLKYASKRLEDDKEIVLRAVKTDGYNLKYASERLKADKEVVLAAVGENGNTLRLASEALKADREVVLTAMKRDGEALQYASDVFKEDLKIVDLLSKNEVSDSLAYFSEKVKKSRAYICEKIKHECCYINESYKEYLADEQIMLCSIELNEKNFQYADKSLKKNREFLLKAVSTNGEVLQYFYKEYKDDKELIERAIENYGGAILWASDKLEEDRTLVLKAVKKDAVALRFLDYDNKLKQDREIVLTTLTQDGMALKQMRTSMQDNREYVLTAVKQNGLALEYASNRLKTDKEIAFEAIAQNGMAIRYTQYQDRALGMLAVKDNWMALRYLNYEFKKDKEIVLEAIKQNSKALKYASYLLVYDKDILESLERIRYKK